MKCTNDDIERLRFTTGTLYIATVNPKYIDAALDRLELAEKCLRIVRMGEYIDWEEFNAAYVAWATIAGQIE